MKSAAVLLLFFINFFCFADLGRSLPVPADFLHAQIIPITVQDIRSNNGYQSPPWPIRGIEQTEFMADLDLYWVSNDIQRPTFVDLRFNARQTNRRWVDVHREMAAFTALDPDRGTATISFYFFEALGSAVGEVNRLVQEQLSREIRTRLQNFAGSKASSLLITVNLPQEAFRGQLESFPVDYEIGFQSYDSNEPKANVSYRKRFTASARLVPVTPAEKEKLNFHLTWRSCRKALGDESTMQ